MMMKTVFALASTSTLLALAAAPALAQSSVTLYGVVGVQAIHSSGATKTNMLDNNSITPSRLGFKGVEDIGGGLKAFFGIESGFSPVSGQTGATMWGRGSFVGLENPLGKVSIGRQWNLNDDLLCGLYACGGYAAFYNFPGFGNSSNLINGAAKYRLPSIAGLNGGLMYAPSANTGTGGRYAGGALTYAVGPVTVGAGYDSLANAANVSDKLALLALKYSFGAGFVRGAWSKSNAAASGLAKATAYDVGGGYSLSPAASFSLDYVSMDREATPDDAAFVRLRGDYALSKRTSLNGNIIRLKNKGASAIALAGGTVNPGGAQNVLTLGVAHSF